MNTEGFFNFFQNDFTSIELNFHWSTNLVEHDAFVNQISNSIKFIYSIISIILVSKCIKYLNLIGNDASTVEWKGRKPTGFA